MERFLKTTAAAVDWPHRIGRYETSPVWNRLGPKAPSARLPESPFLLAFTGHELRDELQRVVQRAPLIRQPLGPTMIGSHSGSGKTHMLAQLRRIFSFPAVMPVRDGFTARLLVGRALRDLNEAVNLTVLFAAARRLLDALAETVASAVVSPLRFLVERLILLLSQLLEQRTAGSDIPVWAPEPIDALPQVAPRGPNPALPVYSNRGGRQRSALGSAVLAA